MVKFIDLNAQYQQLEADIQERLARIFAHGQYIQGEEVSELERQLAEFVGVKHCFSVANGTDALLIALCALGVGLGDEVIVPDFTFVAPAEMVSLLGAKNVFVDVDLKTYNLDVSLLEQAITTKTKAIIPVSLFGQCPDFDKINEIATKYNIPVIEDAAQSFGATYKGRMSCNLSTIACTSFFPSKPLGCYGDGGACFTNDDELATKINLIRNHGQNGRYNHVELGINSRLDTMQAAILLSKMTVFPKEVKRRMDLAEIYTEKLKNHVQTPYVETYNKSVFAQYTIAVENRDEIKEKLQKKGVPVAIHYPKPLHEQEYFKESSVEHKLVNAKKASDTVISLPFSAYLSERDLDIVVKEVIQVLS